MTAARTLALSWAAATLACTSPPSPARATPPSDPATPGPARSVGTILHSTPAISLERHDVAFAGEEFTAIVAALHRDAQLDVRPSRTVVAFDTLLPDGPGPWVAVNGGFYDEAGKPMGLVMSDGIEAHPRRSNGGSGVLFSNGGPMGIVHRDVAGMLLAQEAVQSIDRLADGGVSLVKTPAGSRHAARTAVALGPGAVWLVVAFDASGAREEPTGLRLSHTGSTGPTMGAFAGWLVEGLGAVQAINLDGAISTQMAVRDGDYRWSVRGEAGTVQALVVRP